jgi:PBP1b-binding outer membrane lipoprotein LpoB
MIIKQCYKLVHDTDTMYARLNSYTNNKLTMTRNNIKNYFVTLEKRSMEERSSNQDAKEVVRQGLLQFKKLVKATSSGRTPVKEIK